MTIRDLKAIESDLKETIEAFDGAGDAASYSDIVENVVPILIAEVRRLKTAMNEIATEARKAAK